jgi:hypothetical protein
MAAGADAAASGSGVLPHAANDASDNAPATSQRFFAQHHIVIGY